MRSRRAATICCGGVLVAAVVAWIVGSGATDSSYATYDLVVGVAAVAICVFAILGLIRSSWARVPLVVVIAVAGLLADARFGAPCDCIDLTGFYLPLVVILLGGLAMLITATDRQRATASTAKHPTNPSAD